MTARHRIIAVALAVGVVAIGGLASAFVVASRNASPAAKASTILDRLAAEEAATEQLAEQSAARKCAANNAGPDWGPTGQGWVNGIFGPTPAWLITDWRRGMPPRAWNDLRDSGDPIQAASRADGYRTCWSPMALALLTSGQATTCAYFADGPGVFCTDWRRR